ncbi:MAG TPA: hypothetical protein VFV62_05940 [Gaiellaceae bacterium]|nr:hypothetical protein [Gaiellaceae bacterium]
MRTVLLGFLGLVLAVAVGFCVHLVTRGTISLPVVRLEQPAPATTTQRTTTQRTTTETTTETTERRTTTETGTDDSSGRGRSGDDSGDNSGHGGGDD